MISNFLATSKAAFLNFSNVSSDFKIEIAFLLMLSTSPTSLKYPETPSSFTSGIPPELLEITGTLNAIASNAANPKLSVSEGNKNKSEYFKI